VAIARSSIRLLLAAIRGPSGRILRPLASGIAGQLGADRIKELLRLTRTPVDALAPRDACEGEEGKESHRAMRIGQKRHGGFLHDFLLFPNG
jgi:hypothetical protein